MLALQSVMENLAGKSIFAFVVYSDKRSGSESLHTKKNKGWNHICALAKKKRYRQNCRRELFDHQNGKTVPD